MELIQMTSLALQEDLCREIEKITDGMFFRGEGQTPVPLKAYAQALPLKKEKAGWTEAADGNPEYFPYAVVRIESGKIMDPVVIQASVLLGIFDDSEENQGHRKILNIIQKINERFSKNPILSGAFRMQEGSFEFALPDEDEYPCFFGGVMMRWETAPYRREDEYT